MKGITDVIVNGLKSISSRNNQDLLHMYRTFEPIFKSPIFHFLPLHFFQLTISSHLFKRAYLLIM